MKKIIIVLLFTLPILSFAQKKVTWNYPVKPGSMEWKNFNSRPEMVSACQISSNLLKELSTDTLLNICLNYPLINDIMFYNSSQIGFDNVTKEFNGFIELFRRNDLGSRILKEYISLNVNEVSLIKSSLERGKYMASIVLFEIIISQEEILNKLSKNELHNLVIEAKKKFDEKIKLSHKYSLIGIQSTPLLMGRVMKYDNYENFKSYLERNESCNDFIKTGSAKKLEDFEEITNYLTEYIK